MDNMDNVGLRWYKCDFHLHTMSSKCYKNKATDTADMWVDELKNKKLQCIAITDHNDFRGIDEIKRICDQEGIITFPGVELSCDSSKIHLLILFNIDCSGERVQEFLNKVGIFSDSLGDAGYTCKGDIFEVCETAQEMGGLVIAAHIDEFSGINEFSHDNIIKILDRKYLNAVQIVNKGIWDEYENNNKKAIELLREKYGQDISDDKVRSWHKAYLLTKESGLPILSFSDNPHAEKESKHGLWGIGKNYTWLKMNQNPNLESVRQAFLSYDMRVKNNYESNLIPDVKPDLWIKAIKISNTTLNEEKKIYAKFNPQLNTVIGGRGSGKSSLIRIMAGGLQSFEADNLDLISSEQKGFYKKVGKDKKGIFKTNSVIKIYVERTGDLYKIEISGIQDMNNQTRVLYKSDGDNWIEIEDINYMDFFKAQIYTQKQIYELALDSNSLLSIIDDDIDNVSKKKTEKEATLSKVIAKWMEIKDLNKSINEEDKINTELKDIEEQIGKYEASGISEVLKEVEAFDSQKKVIDDYVTKKNEQIDKMSKIMEAIDSEKLECSEIDNCEIGSVIKNDNAIYINRKKSILDVIKAMNEDIVVLKNDIETSGWKKSLDDAKKQYSDVCISLLDQGITFDKLDDLLERKKDKLYEQDKIKLDKQQLIVAANEQKILYNQYESIADEISVLRTEFLNDVIGKDANVKFKINKKRNRNSFIQMIKTILNKDNATIDEDINKMADIFFENKGIDKFRLLTNEIRKENDKKTFSARMRSAIIDTPPESFARMISFLPDDDLNVSYKPKNARKYIPLSNASAGQKTTAILTFLLAYGELPLLLDQPEDDLDNKLVYDLIVDRLKKSKSKRQIIVVTHNANIPVNGDAEYIISMDSETDNIDTKYEGTMDDENIRKEICDVMEGTQYAFEMRAKKYHFNIVE